jgi:serine/threonine protein kinase
MTLEPDVLLYNRYKITAVLTHGGMGAIYRAYDQSLNMEVAVKENLFSTEEGTRQFHREATILASLRHSNMPRVTDHFVIEGQGQYLVMDFIEGDDMRQRLARQGALPEDEVSLIGATICDALSYLHNRQPQILHRDIKPGNIKITPAGQVYLVDFGLAKVLQGGQATTIGAQALTPGFAPPEQYGQGTDARSDLYALGATLYAALTNVTPEDALARALNSTQLTPITKVNPKVSRQMASVVEKSMSVSPEQRYQSAEEMKQALLNANTLARKRASMGQTLVSPSTADATVISQSQSATPGGTMRTIRATTAPRPMAARSGRRPWVKWLLIALIGLGVIGGGGAAVLFASGVPQRLFSKAQPSATAEPPTPTVLVAAIPSSTSTERPPATATSQPTATLQPSKTPLPTLPSDTPAPSPTFTVASTAIGGGAGEIAFASNRTGTYQIWLMNSDGTNQRQVTNLKEGACQPAWSPDGQRLVFVSPCDGKKDQYPGSSLFIINADGSGKTVLSDSTIGEFDPSWSPDGTRIVCTSLRDQTRDRRFRQLFIYNLADKSVTKLSQNIYESNWAPAWSPDGTEIAYVSDVGGLTRIFRIGADGKTAARRFTRDEWELAFNPAWSPDGKEIIYAQKNMYLPNLVGQKTNDLMTNFVIFEKLEPIWNAKFSADGMWIVYQGVFNGENTDIFLMSPNGTDITRLTTDPLLDIQPAWRPAGQ